MLFGSLHLQVGLGAVGVAVVLLVAHLLPFAAAGPGRRAHVASPVERRVVVTWRANEFRRSRKRSLGIDR